MNDSKKEATPMSQDSTCCLERSRMNRARNLWRKASRTDRFADWRAALFAGLLPCLWWRLLALFAVRARPERSVVATTRRLLQSLERGRARGSNTALFLVWIVWLDEARLASREGNWLCRQWALTLRTLSYPFFRRAVAGSRQEACDLNQESAWFWKVVRKCIYLVMPALLTYLFLHGLNNWLVGRATEKIENEIAWNEDGVPFVNESSIARVNNGDSLLTINPKDVGLEDSDSVPDELKNNQRLEDGLTNTLNSVYVSLLLYNQFHSEAEGSSPKLNDYHETISSFDEFDRFVKSELNVPIMRITKDHAQREAWFHYLNKSFFAEESKRKNWRLVEFVDDPDESKAEWKVINAHLSNVHAHWAKSLPIRVIRWTNGWIQCVTAYLFWLALTVLAVRLISLRIHAEIVSSRGHFLTGKGVDGLQSERPRIRMSWVLRHPKRGSRLLPVADDEMPFSSEDLRNEVKDLESPVNWKVRTSSPVLILRNLYRTHLGELHDDEDDQQDLGLATSALQHFTQNQKDQQESGLAEVMYLAWAIPSVGFIGTVLGIGDGLLGAGAMITPNMEQQKIAIESVTLALGAAFDTTLVALVLSIPLMLTLYLVRRWQADRLLKFQERVMENVLPYFPGLRKDAVGGVVAAVLPTGGRKSKTVKKRAVGRKRTAKS